MKEKDIEAKLKQVISDWAIVDLTFTAFKNRGELLLKAQETLDIVTMLEDSMMILNSLASNRYFTDSLQKTKLKFDSKTPNSQITKCKLQ